VSLSLQFSCCLLNVSFTFESVSVQLSFFPEFFKAVVHAQGPCKGVTIKMLFWLCVLEQIIVDKYCNCAVCMCLLQMTVVI